MSDTPGVACSPLGVDTEKSSTNRWDETEKEHKTDEPSGDPVMPVGEKDKKVTGEEDKDKTDELAVKVVAEEAKDVTEGTAGDNPGKEQAEQVGGAAEPTESASVGDDTDNVGPENKENGLPEPMETDSASEGVNGALPDTEQKTAVPATPTKNKEEDIDFTKFLTEVQNGYPRCEFHHRDCMEKNIVCLTCQALMCALCLRDYHQGHDIVSVGKLKECKEKRDSMEEDLSRLQMLHRGFSTHIEDRKKLKMNTEASCQSLLGKLDTAFEQLKNTVAVKHHEIRNHIKAYASLHTDDLDRELTKVTELEHKSRETIKRVIRSFTRTGLAEEAELPTTLKLVVHQCEALTLPDLDVRNILPEKKFSKILPSLQAVSNICQTIHPEATKVVWSKVTPEQNKRKTEDDGRPPKLKKPKIEPIDPTETPPVTTSATPSLPTTKISTSSSHSSNTSTSRTTTPAPRIATNNSKTSTTSHTSRTSSSSSRTSTATSASGSKTNTSTSSQRPVTHAVASPTVTSQSSKTTSPATAGRRAKSPPPASRTRSPARSSSGRSNSVATEDSDIPDSSTATDPAVDNNPLTMEVGRSVLIRGHMEKLWIGRISNTDKLKDTKFFNVQWFVGEVGTNTSFQIAERWIKKSDNVHVDCVICHFEFDSSVPISKSLEKILITAAEKHKEAQERAKRNPPPPSQIQRQQERERQERERQEAKSSKKQRGGRHR